MRLRFTGQKSDGKMYKRNFPIKSDSTEFMIHIGGCVLDNKTPSEKLHTEELMHMLESCDSFEQIVQQSDSNITNPNLSAYLSDMLKNKSLTIPQVIEKANLSRSYGYQVFNGLRNPARDILIRISFAMQLTVDETQRLLKIAQRGELYPRVKRDAAIIFCIQNKLTLYEMDDLLESVGESALA
jgi:transcriptional regulator with XRE-family HTH domain